MPLPLEKGAPFLKDSEYWPFQGDTVQIIGDCCETLTGEDIRNSAGVQSRFVWKMREFPELPVPREFADKRLTLVGDAELYFGTAVLPVDWPEQEGLDLALKVPKDSMTIEVPAGEQERRTLEGLRRRTIALLSKGFIDNGVDEARDGWMLRPSPHPLLRARAFELAEVFLDTILEEHPKNIEKLEDLGKEILIHRDWPVIPPYSDAPLAIHVAGRIVQCALEGGKSPGVKLKEAVGRAVLFKRLYIPDWSEMDIEEMFREAVTSL